MPALTGFTVANTRYHVGPMPQVHPVPLAILLERMHSLEAWHHLALECKRAPRRHLRPGSQRAHEGALLVFMPHVITLSTLSSTIGGSPGDFAALGGTCRYKQQASKSMKGLQQVQEGTSPG